MTLGVFFIIIVVKISLLLMGHMQYLTILKHTQVQNTYWNDVFFSSLKVTLCVWFVCRPFIVSLLNIDGSLNDFSTILKSLYDPSIIIRRPLDDLKSLVYSD